MSLVSTLRHSKEIRESRFYPQLDAVLLPGIAMAGLDVVDIHRLHRKPGRETPRAREVGR